MAGSIFTSFGAGDANATAFMTHLTAMTKGYNALSLTNMGNTTVPAIAAGSLIENNGALFKFDTEEAISTTDPVTSATVADGTVYIMLVPSGSSISACFTATSPTWSDSKQGWYGTSTYANNRYLNIIIYKSSSSYISKRIFAQGNKKLHHGRPIILTPIGSQVLNYTSAAPGAYPFTASTDIFSEFLSNVVTFKHEGYYNSSGIFTATKNGGTIDNIRLYIKINSSSDQIEFAPNSSLSNFESCTFVINYTHYFNIGDTLQINIGIVGTGGSISTTSIGQLSINPIQI